MSVALHSVSLHVCFSAAICICNAFIKELFNLIKLSKIVKKKKGCFKSVGKVEVKTKTRGFLWKYIVWYFFAILHSFSPTCYEKLLLLFPFANCKTNLLSISSTFYAHIFCTKIFYLLRVWLWVNFCTKNTVVKCWWNWHLKAYKSCSKHFCTKFCS